MPRIKHSEVFAYNAKSISELILDIEKYPEFLPWCSSCCKTQITNDQEFIANMTVNFGIFTENFDSKVSHYEEGGKYYINVDLIKGPFKSLHNQWVITPITDAKSEVSFEIEFQFTSPIINGIATKFLPKAFEKVMNAFKERIMN